MREDITAELFVCMQDGLFEYNVAYVRDGSVANTFGGWESAGIFPCIHDALEQGKEWLEDAKLSGYKRGARSLPHIRRAA